MKKSTVHGIKKVKTFVSLKIMLTRGNATLLREKLISLNMVQIKILSVIFVAVTCCTFLSDVQKLTIMLRELCCS